MKLRVKLIQVKPKRERGFWGIPIFLIFTSLILVGSFYDHSITAYFSGKMVPLARFTEIFGGFPVTLILFIGTVIPIVHLHQFSKLSVISKYATHAMGILASSLNFYVIFRYLNPESGNSHGTVSIELLILALVFGLFLYRFTYQRLNQLNKNQLSELVSRAVWMLIFALIVIVLTNGIKAIWARPRFWYIELGMAQFQPWYQISGLTWRNELMSFVSGHTTNAFALLGLSFLFDPNSKRYKQVIHISWVWAILVAMGRLGSSQHYLTDVVFAMVLVVCVFMVMNSYQLNIKYTENEEKGGFNG